MLCYTTNNPTRMIKLKEMWHCRQKQSNIVNSMSKYTHAMKRKKIDSFEDLAEYDKDAMKILIELARITEPIPLEGTNIGLFGLTSTGKSTLLNTLLGQKIAETTTKITLYKEPRFTFWDVPGRNEEVFYFSMEYISFFKGLSRRLILIQATVKENSSMMKLLDEIGLRYAIVLNKFDKVEKEEQTAIENIVLKRVDNIFFCQCQTIADVSCLDGYEQVS